MLFITRIVLRFVKQLLIKVIERSIKSKDKFSVNIRTFILDIFSKILMSRKEFFIFENWTKIISIYYFIKVFRVKFEFYNI